MADELSVLDSSAAGHTTPDHVDIYHYVLAFNNPFDLAEYECTMFDHEIACQSAELRFKHFFKLGDHDINYQEGLIKLRNHMAGKDKISYKVLVQVMITTILNILQNNLQIDVIISISILNDKIFFKLLASDHNLQVQADLIDYQLQFKADPEDKMSFQQVPPYGPFEKRDHSDNKLSNPEDLYKRYNDAGDEAGKGSLFKYIDKVRLVHSMIKSVFELGELLNDHILVAEYPQHDHRILQYFDKE